MIYTTHYIQVATNGIQQTDMYTNLRQPKIMGKKNYLKANLYIKNININIKNKTNRPLTENSSTRKPGEKKPHSTPTSIANPKQVI